MKIVVFEAEPREEAGFQSLKAAHDVVLVSDALSAANAASYADAEIISAFIYSDLSDAVLAKMPRLKLVATRSTGTDHIDMAYCLAHGVAVANVPTYGENTVAEHVFALLLALSHRLPEAIERARSGRFSPEGLEGVDLAGKTLGVVGTGNIGRHVIRIAKGFAMEVMACDIRPNPDLAQAMGFRYASLDAVLAASDVVSLHVPAEKGAPPLLSANAFGRMKDGVIVINTARGSLIDSHALIMALQSGKVGGAGLDVLPDEPLIREEAELICSINAGQWDLRNLVADHVLLHLPNVIVTPHSAFNTREAVGRIAATTLRNIEAFIAGAPENVIGRASPSRA